METPYIVAGLVAAEGEAFIGGGGAGVGVGVGSGGGGVGGSHEQELLDLCAKGAQDTFCLRCSSLRAWMMRW